jgi:hypothetical protein
VGRKYLSPDVVPVSTAFRFNIACQDVNFREIKDMKRICETADYIP